MKIMKKIQFFVLKDEEIKLCTLSYNPGDIIIYDKMVSKDTKMRLNLIHIYSAILTPSSNQLNTTRAIYEIYSINLDKKPENIRKSINGLRRVISKGEKEYEDGLDRFNTCAVNRKPEEERGRILNVKQLLK